jgi:hypothetical protein
MPGEYFECTRKLTTTKSNQDKQQHGIYMLNIDEHDTTWHIHGEQDTGRTTSDEHGMNMLLGT